MIATLYFGGWQIPYLPTDRLIANAPMVLKVLLSLGLIGSFVGAILFLVFDKRMCGTWPKGDMRNQEGKILFGMAAVAFVIHAVLLYFFWSMELPEWGRATVTLVAQTAMFMIKMLFFCWVFIWVRWTLPRFRYDQIMRLGWKNLIPLAFLNIFLTGLVILLIDRFGA